MLGVTTQKYADYVPTLAVPTSLNLVRFQPLAGTGLMVFEAKLVYALIDTYFGGKGRHTKIEGRDFTATENHIIQMLLDQVIAGVEEAWAPVLPAKVEYLSRETNPHFANLASPTELIVVSRLRIDFDGRGGEFHITLPYATLEPLKDTLRAGMQSDRADREERWSQLLRNELEDSEVELVTRLGSIHMTVGSLIDMRPGDIIPLDFDGHATVLSDGVPLFSGDLGQQRGMQVVRVNEMKLRKSGNSLDAFMRKNRMSANVHAASDVVLDIGVQLALEVGRARMTIRDLLALGTRIGHRAGTARRAIRWMSMSTTGWLRVAKWSW